MQVKSRARVADYGEVFTSEREVNAMLDLVKQETERIDSRFLEPACGTGNFLIEILRRKLKVVCSRYKKSQIEYEKYAFLAVSSVYGIDLLEDNVIECRQRLYDLFNNDYFNLYKKKCNESCRKTIQFLLSKNIICGDALTLKTNKGEPIIFSEWSLVSENLVKRRDFSFSEILDGHNKQTSLLFFSDGAEYDKENKMRFDVIIGNPPYQLNDAGNGKSAKPIYHYFIQQAKKLNPHYLTMIIPARWYAGGKGLDDFRQEMLNDDRIRILVDYSDSTECFPGVDIAGGICYFLWEKDTKGDCIIKNIHNGNEIIASRPLNEFKTFIRHSSSVSIVKKAISLNEKTMNQYVSSRKPFGFPTNARPTNKGDILFKWNDGDGYIEREDILVGVDMIDEWKVITSKASYDHGGLPDKDGMRRVFSKIDILPPKTICSETYIVVGSFKDKKVANNLRKYLYTKFVRFLVSQLSFSQDITKDRFSFVPMQDFSEEWTDEKLYKKYGLTTEEIAFIESMIKPMEIAEND